jgi:hypothetical protein
LTARVVSPREVGFIETTPAMAESGWRCQSHPAMLES